MAQSLSNILIHLVFSTKDRIQLIKPEIEQRLYLYIKSLSTDLNCPILTIGGMPDHIHILLNLSRTISLSEYMTKIKANSSKWMKKESGCDFSWQKGYGGFSLAQSTLDGAMNYIANQKEHHKKYSYQDELRLLLNKYKVHFDEKYLWE